jgi:carboxymethylenebutenolidase
MSGEEITIDGPDGAFMGYLAKPAGGGKAPGVVVLQEIFGINRSMREACDELAGQGFVALAPDLFWRLEPGIQLDPRKEADMNRAFALYGEFKPDLAMRDIQASIDTLRKRPECSGKVGDVGYCLGGLLAYLTAARTDANASVGYYGVGIDRYLGEAGNIKAPLILHIAVKDQFVPEEQQKVVHNGLDGHPKATLYDYAQADHAFARPGGEHYLKEAAEQADARTIALFRDALK